MNTPKRYHPFLVTMHWLTVLLMLGAGFLADDHGGPPVNTHMILGALLLAVLVIRVIVRLTTFIPAIAETGNPFFNRLGGRVHLGLYLSMLFILGMGALIALRRNLIGYVLSNGTVTRGAGILGSIHHAGWFAALGLIAVHVGAALYHQFILKDNLIARMWYG
ncbi:MAG: cytochrome b/b6 domain-containing protein [Anaerolineales bacterium]